MNIQISLLVFLTTLFLTSSPINTIQASAVPSMTNSSSIKQQNKRLKHKKSNLKKQQRKQFKSSLKQFKKNQTDKKRDFESTFITILAIAWYPISIALLIIALVLGLTHLLIASIILLSIPILAVLIFGLIFFITLLTSTGDWC